MIHLKTALAAALLSTSTFPLLLHADVTGTTGNSTPQPTIQPSTDINYMIRVVGTADDIGEIGMFAGTFIPAGWIPADGSLLPTLGNAALFTALGNTYGGNGTTNFAVPNLIGKTPIGTGSAPGLTPRSLGDTTGANSVQLTVDNLPPDAHSLPGGGFTGITGSATPYNNMQPSLALNFLFATTGIFPPRSDFVSPNVITPYLATIRISASHVVPPGFSLAQGQSLSINQNQAIFSVLGTNFGGNGVSNFLLPNLSGRAPIDAGSNPTLTTQTLGESTGSESLTLNTSQLPPHSHTLPGGGNTGIEGAGDSQSNMQPTLALHYIIATNGEFPVRSGSGDDNEPLLGQIELFAGDFAPVGYDFCDGQLLIIQQNTALFSLLGTTYGGNGKSNFALPDLDDSLVIGAAPDFSNLGQLQGTETNTLTLDQLPAHDHTLSDTPEPASLLLLTLPILLHTYRGRPARTAPQGIKR